MDVHMWSHMAPCWLWKTFQGFLHFPGQPAVLGLSRLAVPCLVLTTTGSVGVLGGLVCPPVRFIYLNASIYMKLLPPLTFEGPPLRQTQKSKRAGLTAPPLILHEAAVVSRMVRRIWSTLMGSGMLAFRAEFRNL